MSRHIADLLLRSITGFQVPATVVFRDGFETGGFGAWTGSPFPDG